MRFGLIGPSYTARSSAVADEETFNLFLETRGASQAVAPAKQYGGSATGGTMSAFWTPGLAVFSALPQSPVRGSQWAGNRMFAVAGTGLYEVSPSGGYTSLGAVANDSQPVSIAFNGQQLAIVSGGRMYCLTLATNALLDVTAQLVAVPLTVQFDDSYFVVMFQNSNKAQLSDFFDGTTWPPLYVNEVEVFAGNITALIANHRELWVFGARNAQVYQDTGSAEIFDAIPGGFLETGCVGAFVPCRLDNSVFWVSEDERGARMAWRSNGYTPVRISTYAVETDFASYPTLFGMTTYSYSDSGHLFWVLYIPGSQWTWVYDVGEGLWHKRASWDDVNATWGPHNSWNHVFAFGQHLVGDWASGNLNSLSQNNLTDNGNAIRRLRRSPTVTDEMQWMYHSLLNLDLEMGNMSSVIPSDSPGYASALLGPSPGGSAVDTPVTDGTAWANPGNALLNTGVYASCPIVAAVNSVSSSTSVGTSQGGGVAWTTPEDIADNIAYASVDLTSGGSPIQMTLGGSPPAPTTVSNSANPSNQSPPSVIRNLSGFKSIAATDATLYVKVSGAVSATQGGGTLTLNYSVDNGETWTLIQSWPATFSSTTVSVALSGLTDLSSIQVQMIASCGCGPSGYANAALSVAPLGIYAILAGVSQPTSQTLVAAISGLSLAAGRKIVGVGVSLNAYYVGDAPAYVVSLNVGANLQPLTLTTSATDYTAGGISSRWGYDAWTAASLTNLQVNIAASSAGTTTVNANTLTVTVYHVAENILSDALDLTDFGFTVPDTASPEGITAALVAYSNTTTATLTVQLLQAGVPAGDAQTLPLPTGATTLTFGGLTSLFAAQWANADIADSGFGLRVTATATGGASATVYVGYSTLSVFCPPTIASFNYEGPLPSLVDGDGNPRAPQVMVRWSDDRGKTWSNEHTIDLGNLGQYTARAILRRLGRSRYRVYEISMTDPLPWVLKDGYLEVSE